MSVARFAGAEMEKMLGHGVDFGSIGQKRTMLDGKEAVAGIQGDSFVERAGIQAEADVESAKLTGAAQSKLAAAEAQGSTFSSIGGALGKGIGGLGSLGGSKLISNPTWSSARNEANSFFGANM